MLKAILLTFFKRVMLLVMVLGLGVTAYSQSKNEDVPTDKVADKLTDFEISKLRSDSLLAEKDKSKNRNSGLQPLVDRLFLHKIQPFAFEAPYRGWVSSHYGENEPFDPTDCGWLLPGGNHLQVKYSTLGSFGVAQWTQDRGHFGAGMYLSLPQSISEPLSAQIFLVKEAENLGIISSYFKKEDGRFGLRYQRSKERPSISTEFSTQTQFGEVGLDFAY